MNYLISVLCFVTQLHWLYNFTDAANTPFFRKEYIYEPAFQSFYRLHLKGRNWADAKKRCQHEGAQMFYPVTKEEGLAMAAYMKKKMPHFHYIHIGVSDLLIKGEFETITGQPLESVYYQWQPGEPNNHNDNEDCLIMDKSATMNDQACSYQVPFICKKTLESLEYNALCDIPDSAYQYSLDLGKCYKFSIRPATWTEAYKICAVEESYLAVINSQTEAKYLVNLTAAAPKDKFQADYLKESVHLGFHNLYDEDYVTAQGVILADSGYTKWEEGKPDDETKKHCGAMSHNGELQNVNCNSLCYFICEHDIGALSASYDERIADLS